MYDFSVYLAALIASAFPVTTLADDLEPSVHPFTAGVPFQAEYHEKLRPAASEPGVKAIFSVGA